MLKLHRKLNQLGEKKISDTLLFCTLMYACVLNVLKGTREKDRQLIVLYN